MTNSPSAEGDFVPEKNDAQIQLRARPLFTSTKKLNIAICIECIIFHRQDSANYLFYLVFNNH